MAKRKPTPEEIVDVFSHYKKIFNKSDGDLTMTNTRTQKIRCRLENFPPEVIKKAIENLSYSPWHNGENPTGKKYNSIDFITRNDGKIEEWAHKYDKPTNESIRILGDALVENWKIYFRRILGKEPVLSVDDEHLFYISATRIADKCEILPHTPQAVMLAFFYGNPFWQRTPKEFLMRSSWIADMAPVQKSQAVPFLKRIDSKKYANLSVDAAVRILENEGVWYE